MALRLMSESSELAARKQGAHLADIKLEPALEGHEIGPSKSQANSTHAEGSVPSLGVKDELTMSYLAYVRMFLSIPSVTICQL